MGVCGGAAIGCVALWAWFCGCTVKHMVTHHANVLACAYTVWWLCAFVGTAWWGVRLVGRLQL